MPENHPPTKPKSDDLTLPGEGSITELPKLVIVEDKKSITETRILERLSREEVGSVRGWKPYSEIIENEAHTLNNYIDILHKYEEEISRVRSEKEALERESSSHTDKDYNDALKANEELLKRSTELEQQIAGLEQKIEADKSLIEDYPKIFEANFKRYHALLNNRIELDRSLYELEENEKKLTEGDESKKTLQKEIEDLRTKISDSDKSIEEFIRENKLVGNYVPKSEYNALQAEVGKLNFYRKLAEELQDPKKVDKAIAEGIRDGRIKTNYVLPSDHEKLANKATGLDAKVAELEKEIRRLQTKLSSKPKDEAIVPTDETAIDVAEIIDKRIDGVSLANILKIIRPIVEKLKGREGFAKVNDLIINNAIEQIEKNKSDRVEGYTFFRLKDKKKRPKLLNVAMILALGVGAIGFGALTNYLINVKPLKTQVYDLGYYTVRPLEARLKRLEKYERLEEAIEQEKAAGKSTSQALSDAIAKGIIPAPEDYVPRTDVVTLETKMAEYREEHKVDTEEISDLIKNKDELNKKVSALETEKKKLEQEKRELEKSEKPTEDYAVKPVRSASPPRLLPTPIPTFPHSTQEATVASTEPRLEIKTLRVITIPYEDQITLVAPDDKINRKIEKYLIENDGLIINE